VCDLAETCTGTSTICPADTGSVGPDQDLDGTCDDGDNCIAIANPGQEDGDGDDRGDACDSCAGGAAVAKRKLSLVHLDLPTGDERMKFKGTISSFPTTPPIDPVANGIRLLITDETGGEVLDVLVPGGAFDAAARNGWMARGGGSVFIYRDRRPITVEGITKVVLKQTSAGDLRFVIVGRDGTYLAPQGDAVVASLILDPPVDTAGQCGDAVFSSGECISRAGTRLTCK
jgi:hypothetical protein